ncbi:MAG: hypothetical protein P4L84_33345 [Isosphaeraceae bacterium]|nr:hypothetical protein [Isosphaeraceae bacterium]
MAHGNQGEPRQRVNLPMTWPAGIHGPVRLLRSFQKPVIDPASEVLFLRLDHVAGLRTLLLNDREIARTPGDQASLTVRLDDLIERRNVLSLEIELPQLLESDVPAAPWGSISLLVRALGDGDAPPDSLGECGGVA